MSARWHIGDRVQGGDVELEDYDVGTIIAMRGDLVLVGWDSCGQTWQDARDVEPYDADDDEENTRALAANMAS